MTKTCVICLENKPISEFYFHHHRGIYFAKCKSCCKDYLKHYRNTPEERERARERHRLQRKNPSPKARQARNRIICRWAKKNKVKKKAHDTLHRAVKKGLVIKTPCVLCGDPRSEAHHTDYSKPLDVMWLCKPCHRLQHPDLFSRKV